jgi:hypothetical protein
VHRLLLAAGCLVLTGCGSGPSSRTASSPTPSAGAAATARPVATRGASLLAIGGLDAADASVSSIVRVEGARARVVGHLPSPLHDAAAATAGARTLFAGGGEAGTGSAAILRILAVDPASGRATRAGRLPEALSDLSAGSFRDHVTVVGGRDATGRARNEIWSLRPRA